MKRFAPNGYGLYDVAGNVWEWTTTPSAADHTTTGDAPIHACVRLAQENIGEQDRRVIKGGSLFCAAFVLAVATDPRLDKVMAYTAQPVISDFAACSLPSLRGNQRPQGPALHIRSVI